MNDATSSGTSGTSGTGTPGAGTPGPGAGIPGATGAPGVSGTAPAWYESAVSDIETRSWVQQKGWQDVNALAVSARNAEKLIGADPKTIVRMPKAGDTEGQRQMYKQLGMPETADKYAFDAPPEGLTHDPNYTGFIKEAFHKAGLTSDQAKAVVAAHDGHIAAQIAQQAKDYEVSVAAGEQQLQSEWRGGYDRMIGQATQTAKMLGFSAEMIDGLEGQIGYANTLKFLANLGMKLGEDNFVSAEGGKRTFAGNLTPEEAARQWDEMKADQNYIKALFDGDNPGHKAAKDKQAMLFGLMYPS